MELLESAVMENSISCSDALKKGRLCEQASNPHDLAAFSKKKTGLMWKRAANWYVTFLLNA